MTNTDSYQYFGIQTLLISNSNIILKDVIRSISGCKAFITLPIQIQCHQIALIAMMVYQYQCITSNQISFNFNTLGMDTSVDYIMDINQ